MVRRTLAGALLVAATWFPAAAASCDTSGDAGQWRRVTTPEAVRAHAVESVRRFYVATERVIYRSEDGGCAWRAVHTIGEGRLVSLASVPLERPGGLAYAVVAGLAGPSLLRSTDYGESWRPASGLPHVGTPGVFATAGAEVAYLVVEPFLYATGDAGRTWERRGLVPRRLAALAADPAVPRRLYGGAAEPAPMLVSDDGGSTWRDEGEPLPAVRDIDARGGGVAVLGDTHLVRPGAPPLPLPLSRADSVACASTCDEVAVLGSDNDFGRVVLVSGGSLRDATPPGRPDGTGIVRAGSSLSFRGRSGLWTRGVVPVAVLPDLREVPPFPEPRLPPAPPAGLRPATATVALAAGATARREFVLDVAARRGPLDLGLLVDSSGSMQPAIEALRAQARALVAAVAARGVDARYGVAEFQEYRLYPYGGAEPSGTPYRLLRDLGPADAGLRDALRSVRAEGGSADGQTSGYAALYQAATGAGQRVSGGAGQSADIPAGQAFGFRAGRLPVVVIATDAALREAPGYPGPTHEATVTALRSRGIRVVGLDVVTGIDPVRGRAQLQRIARDTGATAATAVDCDGDGSADLRRGDPLVCPASAGAPDALGSALLALVDAVPDPASVEVVVARGRSAATLLTPARYPLGHGLRAAVMVEFRCAPGSRRADVAIVALVRGLPVAHAAVGVRCGDRPTSPPDTGPPARGAPEPGRASRPLPRVAVPVAPPAPAGPGLPPHAITQPATHPLGAAAAAREDQPALALADVDPRTDDDAAPAMLLMSGLATAAAAGALARTRQRAGASCRDGSASR